MVRCKINENLTFLGKHTILPLIAIRKWFHKQL